MPLFFKYRRKELHTSSTMSASPVSVSPASSVIDDGAKSSNMLATVLKLEKELAKMKIALGVEGVKTPKKARKAKDPSAPKKEPNVWIKFTQRVGLLLKTTDHKGPATIGKQFASHLKDIKAYDEWTDAEILHDFSSWTAPAKGTSAAGTSAAAVAEADAASADEAEEGFASAQSEAEAPALAPTLAAPALAAPTPEPKKRGPKAKAPVAPAPPPPTLPPPARAEPSAVVKMLTEAIAAAPASAFKPKAVKSKAAAPTYTMEQLSNFTEFEHNGQTYGRNERGDLVDTESNFMGRWNGKAIETIPEPADWNMCML